MAKKEINQEKWNKNELKIRNKYKRKKININIIEYLISYHK